MYKLSDINLKARLHAMSRSWLEVESYIFCSINYGTPWGTTWNEKSRVTPSFPPACDSFSSLDLPSSSRFVVQIKKGFEKYTRSKNGARFRKVYTFRRYISGIWFIDTSIRTLSLLFNFNPLKLSVRLEEIFVIYKINEIFYEIL